MGFVTRHKKRDLEIQKHRNAIMQAIEHDLLKDNNVLAVFYGGSIGNQSTDIYSDIDLRIVVNDDVFEAYRLNKKQRAKNWGNVLFFEDFPWTNYSIAHYNCFLKVDSFYYKAKDLQPSLWLKDIRIVHDTDSLMAILLEESMQLVYQPSIEEIEIWRTKFFAYFHEAYRRLMRNEYYYALHCIDDLRFSIATAWYMNAGIQPNNFGDWAKLEGKRSKLADWQLSLLASWECGRDPLEIIHVMKRMVPEFKKVHKELCDKQGIDEKPDWVEEIIQMVILQHYKFTT